LKTQKTKSKKQKFEDKSFEVRGGSNSTAVGKNGKTTKETR
jgi:hypothetical protein